VHDILGAKALSEVHNNHNFAWREIHDGEWLWVVRKGATPAYPGQLGFVGGTMGDMAVILEGVHPATVVGEDARKELAWEQELGLFSTVHGAGRAMSRTVAAGKVKKRKLVREGLIASEYGIHNPWELSKWLKEERGVILRGGGLDEAPQAYKHLDEVLAHHRRTINVLDVLKPIGVAMASPDVRDPFKD
jgi:tRNA-splicing ligase RtcB